MVVVTTGVAVVVVVVVTTGVAVAAAEEEASLKAAEVVVKATRSDSGAILIASSRAFALWDGWFPTAISSVLIGRELAGGNYDSR